MGNSTTMSSSSACYLYRVTIFRGEVPGLGQAWRLCVTDPPLVLPFNTHYQRPPRPPRNLVGWMPPFNGHHLMFVDQGKGHPGGCASIIAPTLWQMWQTDSCIKQALPHWTTRSTRTWAAKDRQLLSSLFSKIKVSGLLKEYHTVQQQC